MRNEIIDDRCGMMVRSIPGSLEVITGEEAAAEAAAERRTATVEKCIVRDGCARRGKTR